MQPQIDKVIKYTPYLLLILIISYLAFQINYKCGWLYEDIGKILNSVASGRFLSISEYIRFSDARLIPLAAFDYNILLICGMYKAASSFYILNTIYFLLFVGSFFLLIQFSLNKIDNSKYNGWILLFSILYVIQRFYDPVYLQLQYAERLVLPLFIIIIISYLSYQKSEKISSAIIVFLISVYVTYCKEVNAIVLLVFSSSNLLFDNSLTKKLKILNWILIVNSLIFFIVYFLIIYPQSSSTYYSGSGLSMINLFGFVLRNQKIIIIGIALSFFRLYFLLFKKANVNIVLDSLLFSGIALFIVSVILKLEYFYYYSPVLVLITPGILFYSKKYIGNKITFVLVLAFFILYFYKINYSIDNIQKRRSEEYAKVELIVHYIKSGYLIEWFEVEPLIKNDQNIVYRNWARDAMSDHLRFASNQRVFELIKINEIVKSNRKVVLFSSLNSKLNQSKSLEIIDKINTQPNFSLGGIDVFIFD